MLLPLILLPVAFLLPPSAGAGEIVGGWESKPHSRPYMAYLYIRRAHNYAQCGGFLVAENFVLTAAHCQGDNITVILGVHNLTWLEPKWQVIPVQQQVPHPQYNNGTINNDIMLLQLEKKAVVSHSVGLIPLPRAKHTVKPGTLCTITGWGSLWPDVPVPPTTLQEVDVVVMPDTVCPRNPDWLYRYYDPSTMMCVGDPAQLYDSAKGDSGGPLVCGGMAQGVVSWGYSKAPGVYTKISKFIPWIKKTMVRLQVGAWL